jgi:hypothetical protein
MRFDLEEHGIRRRDAEECEELSPRMKTGWTQKKPILALANHKPGASQCDAAQRGATRNALKMM